VDDTPLAIRLGICPTFQNPKELIAFDAAKHRMQRINKSGIIEPADYLTNDQYKTMSRVN